MKPGRVGLNLVGDDAVVTGGVADVGAAVWGRERENFCCSLRNTKMSFEGKGNVLETWISFE